MAKKAARPPGAANTGQASGERASAMPAQIPDTTDTNELLAAYAERIRQLGGFVLKHIIEIGQHLTEAKRIAGHGNWLRWLEREFRWSEATALRYMRAYDVFGTKSVTVTDLDLPVTALYLLSAASTPEAARDEALREAEADRKKGKPISGPKVKGIIAKHKGRRPTSILGMVHELLGGAKNYVEARHRRTSDDDPRVVEMVIKTCDQKQLQAITAAPESSPFGKFAWRNAAATKLLALQQTPEQPAEDRKALYTDEESPPPQPEMFDCDAAVSSAVQQLSSAIALLADITNKASGDQVLEIRKFLSKAAAEKFMRAREDALQSLHNMIDIADRARDKTGKAATAEAAS